MVGRMPRKEFVVGPSNQIGFGPRSEMFAKRRAGADQAALPILHKKIDSRQMIEQSVELLGTTHGRKEGRL
jgi:hypothetical protein